MKSAPKDRVHRDVDDPEEDEDIEVDTSYLQRTNNNAATEVCGLWCSSNPCVNITGTYTGVSTGNGETTISMSHTGSTCQGTETHTGTSYTVTGTGTSFHYDDATS